MVTRRWQEKEIKKSEFWRSLASRFASSPSRPSAGCWWNPRTRWHQTGLMEWYTEYPAKIVPRPTLDSRIRWTGRQQRSWTLAVSSTQGACWNYGISTRSRECDPLPILSSLTSFLQRHFPPFSLTHSFPLTSIWLFNFFFLSPSPFPDDDSRMSIETLSIPG